MIGRTIASAAVACCCALAQLQVTDVRAGSVCDPNVAIDLGTIGLAGTAASFRITNAGTTGVALETLKISGIGFDVTGGPTTPVTLLSKASVDFKIKLVPTAEGAYSGKLLVNKESYLVVAKAAAGAGGSTKPLPGFRIVVDPQALASGQQAKLAIRFDAKAGAAGNGLLKVDFIGKGDPAIRFISPAGRSAPFTIAEGEDTARFGGEPEIVFQTGTTAGTIIFTATLGADTEQATFQLAPSVVSMDSIRGTRAASELRVAVTAFDNTRSTSRVKFRFLDSAARALGSGEVSADVSALFGQYFEHPELGGMFVLRAAFPVTGDTSQVDAVEVELVNSAGASRASAKMTE